MKLALLFTLMTFPLLASAFETPQFYCVDRRGPGFNGSEISGVVRLQADGALRLDVRMCKLWHGQCLGEEEDFEQGFPVAKAADGYHGEQASLVLTEQGTYLLEAIDAQGKTRRYLFSPEKCGNK